MDRHWKTLFLLLTIILATTVDGTRFKRQEDEIAETPTETPTETPAETPTETPTETPPETPAAEETHTPAPEPETPLEPTPDNTATTMETIAKVESTTPKEWIEKAIKKHNEYRALHGVGPLVYNENLCQISQAYANKIAETHKVEHNPALQTAKLGENLYYDANSSEKEVDPDVPVKAWYDEIHDYNFATGFPFDDSKEILHFTQLVWKKSTDVGIAWAKSKRPDGMFANYVVANYSPRGNFDDFLKNVLPAVGEKAHEDNAPAVKDAEVKESEGKTPEDVKVTEKPDAPSSCMPRLLGGTAILVLVLAGLISLFYFNNNVLDV